MEKPESKLFGFALSSSLSSAGPRHDILMPFKNLFIKEKKKN